MAAGVITRAQNHFRSILRAPARDGQYRVVFDLVQRVGDELRPLAVPAIAYEVAVEPFISPSSRMSDDLKRRSADPTRIGAPPEANV